MKNSKLLCAFLYIFLLLLASACAPIKTIEVWKSETYDQQVNKVLIIGIAHNDSVRNQFENVLANQLKQLGVEAIPSHKYLPHSKTNPDQEVVLAKVRDLGVDSVLVARSIHKDEITNHQYGGVVLGGVAIYDNGWYGASYGYSYDKQYDTEFFTISIKLYDINSNKPVWSYLSQVKVEGSEQGVVNLFVPTLVEQLEASQLVNTKRL